MDKWVVDAGPFIHLDQIGLLRLLKHLPRLIVPPSVLRLEVHGTVGLIAYAVRSQWLSVAHAEDALKALYHHSSLFITYAIIDGAIRHLKGAR